MKVLTKFRDISLVYYPGIMLGGFTQDYNARKEFTFCIPFIALEYIYYKPAKINKYVVEE